MTKTNPNGRTKKCGRCGKKMRLDEFATNPRTSALYSYCEPCRKTSTRNKNEIKKSRLAVQNAAIRAGEELLTFVCLGCGWRPTECFGVNERTGRPHQRCKMCHAKMMQRSAKYQRSEAGKEAKKKYSRSEKGRIRDLRYERSGKGRATRARYKQKEASEQRLFERIKSACEQIVCDTFLERVVRAFD